ncbi:MAG: glycosyltransferase [Phycisphaerales bacterium]
MARDTATDRVACGFVFVGGGTGGHLYPAIAIIEELERIDPSVRSHVVCSERRIDSAILESEDATFSTIPATSPSGGVRGLSRFVRNWGSSVRGVRRVIQEMKTKCDRVVVISMGGFVSAPGAMAARAEKCELVLVNLDAVPGKANRWIRKRADRAFTGANIIDSTPGKSDWIQTRAIVRGFHGRRSAERACEEFGLDSNRKTMLVTGGSQGAQSINQFMVEMGRKYPDALEGWQILHQVGGGGDGEFVALGYRDAGIQAVVVEYIEEMGAALLVADFAIGRCGAGTVAECWESCVPSVFFPYPFHKDEHQKHNAAVLVDAGCALVCEDHIDPHKNLEAHGMMLAGLICDLTRIKQMAEGYQRIGIPDGASVIARSLLDA